MHYPKDWWEDETHPERKYFLKDVVGEPDDPDEDDQGVPLYQVSKCPKYKEYLRSIKEQEEKVKDVRKFIESQNEKLVNMGKQPKELPEFKRPTEAEVKEKIRQFREEFD